MSESERPECGHLRDQAGDLQHPVLGIADLARLRIERRKRADGGHQHPHGMRVVAEPFDELLEVLVDERVIGDAEHPLLELSLGW